MKRNFKRRKRKGGISKVSSELDIDSVVRRIVDLAFGSGKRRREQNVTAVAAGEGRKRETPSMFFSRKEK